MKKIHLTRYKLFNKNIKNDIKIIVISDLHYSDKIKDNKLNMILDFIRTCKPNYILFPGDIINSLDEIEDKSNYDRLINWFKRLTQISKVIVSFGNHEYYKKDELTKKHTIGNPKKFYNKLNTIKDVYFLDNTEYQDNEIEIVGFNENPLYIHPLNVFYTIFNPTKENKIGKIEELKKLNNIKLNDNKIKILLSHSPVYYKDKELLKLTKDYDYIISGHMHNGAVMPGLYDLWNSSYGLISPTKKLFPSLTRNTLKTKDDKLIVNGALTTFHTKKIILKLLNSLYPYYMTELILTNNSKYDTDKIYKETKYINKNSI